MKYQNTASSENIHTPLLNMNYKKLPKKYKPKSSSYHNVNPSNILSRIYYWFAHILERLFPCCNKVKEKHICYFPELEDRITIQHNYMLGEKCHPYIFWDEPYEEEVFFDENEQKIINLMKEKIKKYQ